MFCFFFGRATEARAAEARAAEGEGEEGEETWRTKPVQWWIFNTLRVLGNIDSAQGSCAGPQPAVKEEERLFWVRSSSHPRGAEGEEEGQGEEEPPRRRDEGGEHPNARDGKRTDHPERLRHGEWMKPFVSSCPDPLLCARNSRLLHQGHNAML